MQKFSPEKADIFINEINSKVGLIKATIDSWDDLVWLIRRDRFKMIQEELVMS